MHIGRKSYGKKMEFIVAIFIALTQFGFAVGMTYFLISQLQSLTAQYLSIHLNFLYIGLIFFVILAPLSWVKDISKFAAYNLFANIIILISIVVVIYVCVTDIENDGRGKDFSEVGIDWANMIGYSVYAYEGVGLSKLFIFFQHLLIFDLK